jgi:hypothetical protein
MVMSHSDNNYIYSVDMMFVYLKNHKMVHEKIPISQLIHNLEYKGWGNVEKSIYYSALDVLKSPRKYQKDYIRIQKADLKWPIIINEHGDIIDGVHRLTKAHLEGKYYIKAYIFDDTFLKKFRVAKKDEWSKVDNMQLYDYMNIYVNRFC